MDAIDDVLDLLKNTGVEYSQGFSNHGPMASEAMLTLGRADLIVNWAEHYKRRLRELPKGSNEITDANWKEAIGQASRVADWINYFNRQLAEKPWQDVLSKWIPHLCSGFMAGSTHGFLRTAHNTRSLSRASTPQRINELAEGLAYWAAYYQALPTAAEAPGKNLLVSKAIKFLHPVSAEVLESHHFHLIRESTSLLDEVDSFDQVINLVDASIDYSTFLSDLSATFAACYLKNATSIGHAITMIHCVTAPSAIRLIAPHVNEECTRQLLRYAWQTAAALYTIYGQEGFSLACSTFDGKWDDIIERAIATGDEHAVKFTEACLREHKINSNPIFLAAACHATRLIGKEPVKPESSRC